MRFNKYLLLFLFICVGQHAWSVTFPNDWAYQSQLQTNPAQVVAAELAFPVLLTANELPAEMIDNDGTQDALANGGDIRFTTDAAGLNPIPFDLVSFNPGGTPTAEIWVQIPALDNVAATSFYIWWGAAGASIPAFNDPVIGRNQVWSSYTAVWHLEENPTGSAGDYVDSTGNGWDSINTGNQPTRTAAGTIGAAAVFNGGQQITIMNSGDVPNLDTPGAFTLQGWVSQTSMTGFRTWLCKGDAWAANNNRWQFYNPTNNSVNPGIGRQGSEANWTAGGDPDYTGTPAYFTITYDTTNALLIHNGTAYNPPRAFTPGTDATAAFNIGRAGGGEQWSGTIDEVRISQFVRPTSWIQTEYNNMNNPGTFYAAPGPVTVLNGRYFVGPGTDWHTGTNWSTVSGGAGGAGIPGASHLAIFDINSPALTVNATAAITVTSIQIDNFSGTINANNQTITLDAFAQTSGTFSNTNGTFNITGAYTVNGGTFTATGNTTNATGAANQTFDLNGAALNNLNLNGAGGVNINSAVTIAGTATVTTGPLSAAANTTFQGNLVCNNSVNLTGTTTFFDGTSTLSGGTEPIFSTLTVNAGASLIVDRDINVTTASVNGTLINNAYMYLDIPPVLFNAAGIADYGGQNQDDLWAITNGGRIITLTDNTWLTFAYGYNITAATRISFEFFSTVEETDIHSIGMDNNTGITQNRNFRIYGTQNWGNATYLNYPGNAGTWMSFDIPIGTHYTGNQNYITLIRDDDGNLGGFSSYRNVRLTEGPVQSLAVNVSATGTLGGSGNVQGNVTVAGGGTLSPGAMGVDVNTLTVSQDTPASLTLNNTSDLRFDLGAPGTGDRVALTGTTNNLTLDGSLTVTNAGGLTTGLYTLFTYAGALTDNTLTVTMPIGYTGVIDLSTPNQVNLNVTELNIIVDLQWSDGTTAPRTMPLGIMLTNATSSAFSYAILNAGNSPIDVEISASDSANWTNSSVNGPGPNLFVFNLDADNDGLADGITNFETDLSVPRSLTSNLAASSTHPFKLSFTSPSGSTTATPQAMQVTLTVTSP